MAQYREIEPSAPDRIIQMAEKEQEFRHRMTSRSLTADITAHFAGPAIGALVCFALIAGAVYLAVVGQTSVALALLGASVLNLVGLFVNAKRKKIEQSPAGDAEKERPVPPKPPSGGAPKTGNRKRRR